MQTILGAGGSVGNLLAKELRNYTNQIRLVSRNPKTVIGDEESVSADLLDFNQTLKAVENSKIVYLIAGLTYKTKIWKRDWFPMMQNVVNACQESGAKLVFLDNIYMYNPSKIGFMDESTPMQPTSEKGKVRKQLVDFLLSRMQNQQIAIGRSSDFYGKDCKNGVLNISLIDPIKANKKPFWIGDDTKIHSFTHIEDLAKGLTLIGNNDDCYGQTWHLPTSNEKWTGKDFLMETNSITGKSEKFRVIKKLPLQLAGFFSSDLREIVEMYYQYADDYYFDSKKFNKRFDYTPKIYNVSLNEIFHD